MAKLKHYTREGSWADYVLEELRKAGGKTNTYNLQQRTGGILVTHGSFIKRDLKDRGFIKVYTDKKTRKTIWELTKKGRNRRRV